MLITLSLAFVTGAITVALIWSKKVGIGSGLFVWLSGFTLAGTGMGVPVTHFLAAMVTAIAHH
ncbi:hypothetical protein [Streptacidiphilus sp. PAMC 29251]